MERERAWRRFGERRAQAGARRGEGGRSGARRPRRRRLMSCIQVVLVGRPNVGKSAFFNRLADSRRPWSTTAPG